MSTVKKIFMINKKIVYLIHFNGWGDEFNEFIEEGIRLTYYNHYKHKQFQSKKIKEKEAGFISLMFLITDLDTYIQ